ncbi:MAG: molybdenum ABC transporter ATP-binding protein [Candidatus Marinimicrobia bacterium]|nr:molybdenum ABC transporter ATP-binding protein [Candidatus Neomarinimicrobiota bacterium]
MNYSLQIDIELPLDQFTLRVEHTLQKKVTGVFGVSGSGKTSFLETVAGLRKDSRGLIVFNNEIWLDTDQDRFVPPESRGIGYVPQDILLFPNRDVKGNLLSGAKRAARNGVSVDELFERVVRLLNIGSLLSRHVGTLSGGEKQRVALGRALCSGAELLLLDEPLASLDIALRRKVLPFIKSIREEFDIPIIVVSHNPVEVQALCDELLALEGGEVTAIGSPQNVLTNPAIFPLAEREGYQNVLDASILRHESDATVVCPGNPDCEVEIYTRRASGEPGDDLQISIPAHDIIIANQRPPLTSARNILEVNVTEIQPFEDVMLVLVELHESVPPIAVEVTSVSLNKLGIETGKRIYLIIKTVSWTLYEVESASESSNS